MSADATSPHDRRPSAADLARDHAFVVLAYRESPFLAGCLDSLAAQTVKSRLVVATSTPNDAIAEAAAAHGVEVIVNPVREAIASDFNFGLRASGARLVTLAHQDDTYAPDFLERTLAEFAAHDGALCFTSYVEIDDAGRPIRSKVSVAKHAIEGLTLGARHVLRGARLRAFLSLGNALPCSSVTYDLARLGDFAFSVDFVSNLDWDAWWRLQAAGHTFLRAPYPLVGRRHNDLAETARRLRDGTRRTEDLVMFRRAWPSPLAEIIAAAYRAGY
ncbi:MAG TPA: glycosyltransferase [Caulobacteraceae bacterium]|nr:glycosyltransferase [Caulobacteraceae bacterium]